MLAIAMIALPLRGMLNREAIPVDRSEQKQANLAIFQSRLNELETEHENGRISGEEYAQLRCELEKSLLNDLPGNGDEQTPPLRAVGSMKKWLKLSSLLKILLLKVPRTPLLAVLAFVGVPLLALGLYALLGDYKGLSQSRWMDETRHMLAQQGNDMEGILAQLENRLAENPEVIEGWVLLGRSYMTLERYPQAAESFAKVAALLEMEKENPAVGYGLLAQALYFASKGVTPGVQSAVKKALTADPGESNALSILGVAAFQQEMYQEAARYWQTIIDNNPNDPNAEAIQNGINRALALAAAQDPSSVSPNGEEASPRGQKASPNGEKAGAPVELTVNVSLSESVRSAAGPEDAVYILARPANGGRMPLAVTRVRVADLPLTVTLNDSMAMGPMAKLSSVTEVEVIARVSKAGTPQPQSGDIEGLTGPIVLRDQTQPLPVVIERIIP